MRQSRIGGCCLAAPALILVQLPHPCQPSISYYLSSCGATEKSKEGTIDFVEPIQFIASLAAAAVAAAAPATTPSASQLLLLLQKLRWHQMRLQTIKQNQSQAIVAAWTGKNIRWSGRHLHTSDVTRHRWICRSWPAFKQSRIFSRNRIIGGSD